MIVPSQLQILATDAAAPKHGAPRARLPRRPRRPRSSADVVIRFARPRDAGAIRDLEALDSRVLGDGQRLVAEHDGIVVAAISVADGKVAADPFECTINSVALLRVRARQLRMARVPAPAPRLTFLERLAAR